MQKFLLCISLAFLAGCGELTEDTSHGVCRENLEVCVSDEPSCILQTIWIECNADGDNDSCEWTEFGETYRVPIEMSTSCEDCNPSQCINAEYD